MESPPKKIPEEKYKGMDTTERLANRYADFFGDKIRKRIAKERAWNIKQIREKRKYEEARQKQEQLRREAAANVGAINTSTLENTKIIGKEGEKNIEMSVGRLLLTTFVLRSAEKRDKRWEEAKKTLKDPFTLTSLGKLFKDIGKEMMGDITKK